MLFIAIHVSLFFAVAVSLSQPERLLTRVSRFIKVPLQQRRQFQPWMPIPAEWVPPNMPPIPIEPKTADMALQDLEIYEHNKVALYNQNRRMFRQTVSEISISILNALTIELDESVKSDGNFWICEKCTLRCSFKKNYKLPAATTTIQIRFKDQLKAATSWFDDRGNLWIELYPPPFASAEPYSHRIWFYSDRAIKNVYAVSNEVNSDDQLAN